MKQKRFKSFSFATKDNAFTQQSSKDLNIIIKSDVHGYLILQNLQYLILNMMKLRQK